VSCETFLPLSASECLCISYYGAIKVFIIPSFIHSILALGCRVLQRDLRSKLKFWLIKLKFAVTCCACCCSVERDVMRCRYPTKEWKSLGTFHARDERLVQTFPVQDAVIFGKYLRVDMLSHYGTEHFCPLTVLRSQLL